MNPRHKSLQPKTYCSVWDLPTSTLPDRANEIWPRITIKESRSAKGARSSTPRKKAEPIEDTVKKNEQNA